MEQRGRDWDAVYNELWQWIRNNDGVFPTRQQLQEDGRGDLIYKIREHGGFAKVRERCGYNEQKQKELAHDLENIIEKHF